MQTTKRLTTSAITLTPEQKLLIGVSLVDRFEACYNELGENEEYRQRINEVLVMLDHYPIQKPTR